jgi:hypothetical protein
MQIPTTHAWSPYRYRRGTRGFALGTYRFNQYLAGCQVHASPQAEEATASLWCYCNTLNILTQRHTAGRIAWSHTNAFQRIGGAS